MMNNRDVSDRLLLELAYNRPSFHCGHPSCTGIGQISAIMEQHQDSAHAELVVAGSSFAWDDFCCELCGFDGKSELHRLYPNPLE